ncbi:GTP 3',8-cyclase MoaA, partial [Caulobacter sp. B11]
VAITTNGWNLKRNIHAWRGAGLTNLNVSIDALDPAAFHRITGHDQLGEIIAGLDLAWRWTSRVKVNAVLLRDTVETGFDAFADFVRDRRSRFASSS